MGKAMYCLLHIVYVSFYFLQFYDKYQLYFFFHIHVSSPLFDKLKRLKGKKTQLTNQFVMLYQNANLCIRSCFSLQRMMNCYFAFYSERDQEAHLRRPQGVLPVARQKSHTSANIGHSRPSEKAILPNIKNWKRGNNSVPLNFFLSLSFFLR